MMKSPMILCTLAVLASCSLTPSTYQEVKPPSQWEGGVNFLLGARNFTDDDNLEPVEDHLMFGFEGHAGKKESVVSVEYGLAYSNDDDDVFVSGLGVVDVEATSFEGYVGARFSPVIEGAKSVHPYVGIGLSVINLDLEIDTFLGSASEDDSSLAAYVHGGVLFDLGDHAVVGIDLRTLFGSDIDIAGVSGDADYFQIAAVFGVRF